MRVYPDSSFLVKLLDQESGTPEAIGLYRSLGRPSMFFLPLHRLEVTNAIRHRAFHQERTEPSKERPRIRIEEQASQDLLLAFVAKKVLIEVAADSELALERACKLSERHTRKLGSRSFDLMHVALALELQAEMFLTSDKTQGAVAHAEGLAVQMVPGARERG